MVQGLDIIAEQDGVKVGFQCKLYSKPVGNKAIQEAYAGFFHYGLNFGAVVSNHQYTKSAKELANTTGIKLFHHGQLSSLSPEFFQEKRYVISNNS